MTRVPVGACAITAGPVQGTFLTGEKDVPDLAGRATCRIGRYPRSSPVLPSESDVRRRRQAPPTGLPPGLRLVRKVMLSQVEEQALCGVFDHPQACDSYNGSDQHDHAPCRPERRISPRAPPMDDHRDYGEHRQERSDGQGCPKVIGTCGAAERRIVTRRRPAADLSSRPRSQGDSRCSGVSGTSIPHAVGWITHASSGS